MINTRSRIAYSTNTVLFSAHPEFAMSGLLIVRQRHVSKLLKNLKADSGTGPDMLPAQVLKKCFSVLALPLTILVRLIIREGVWPEMWKVHWLFPLYKRKTKADPSNHRGIHLTSQMSKVCERAIALHLMPFLLKTDACGSHQFAYLRQRGYRDALAFVVTAWIWAIGQGRRVAFFVLMWLGHLIGSMRRVSSKNFGQKEFMNN